MIFLMKIKIDLYIKPRKNKEKKPPESPLKLSITFL